MLLCILFTFVASILILEFQSPIKVSLPLSFTPKSKTWRESFNDTIWN